MSGGANNMKHSVKVTAKPAFMAPALDKFDEAKILK